jgi:phage/plasmid primase-like uncharacterized protein
MSAAAIVAALGGRWCGTYGVCRCPAHDDKHPSLSITDGSDGRLLVHCFAGCDGTEVLAHLRGRGMFTERDETVQQALDRDHAEARRRAQAQRAWEEAGPIEGTLGEAYLRHRGYRGPIPEALRFNPSAWHQSAKYLPAIVASVVIGSDLVAVHRTYLAQPGRKAAVNPVKASLGPVKGGAVRLSEGQGPIVVAEGIETALALLDAHRSHQPRVWAALSAGNMADVHLPPSVGDRLVVAYDNDPAGIGGKERLAVRARRAGWRVQVLPPPEVGDWADLAAQEAAA